MAQAGSANNRRAGLTALEETLACLQRKAALILPLRVAFDARRLEKRLDVPGKIDRTVHRRREGSTGRGQRERGVEVRADVVAQVGDERNGVCVGRGSEVTPSKE